jgi:dTDP-4-dehydrorhamnose reductase
MATHFSHASAGSLYFDALSTPVADLVSRLPSKPAAAVILLGITNIDACARDPAGSAEVNVRGIIRVIDDARALGIMPVFVSSDAVFDGSRAYWSEDDEPIPILTYGRQKLEVERHLAALPPPWIIAQLVQAQAQGLYHLGRPERLNRRVLLGAVIDEYRKFATPVAEIIDCSLRDIPDLLEPRPLDTLLRSDRFKADFGTPFRAAGEVARAVQSYFAARDGRK